MDKGETWLKLYRSTLDWEWYGNINTCRLFRHLLLRVNITDQRKRGIVIPAGSIDRTYSQLCEETGLSERQVRTALEHMRMSGEVTVERHPFFSVFTVVRWESYQVNRQKNYRRPTHTIRIIEI